MHEKLIQEFSSYAKTATDVHSLMTHIAKRLHDSMSRYNWVGFYEVDPADSNVLVVGPLLAVLRPMCAFR